MTFVVTLVVTSVCSLCMVKICEILTNSTFNYQTWRSLTFTCQIQINSPLNVKYEPFLISIRQTPSMFDTYMSNIHCQSTPSIDSNLTFVYQIHTRQIWNSYVKYLLSVSLKMKWNLWIKYEKLTVHSKTCRELMSCMSGFIIVDSWW